MIRLEAIGNLGDDAKLKVAGTTDVANFRLAAKGSRRDAESQWISCALFGARAAKLSEFLKKGKRVFVRGEAKLRRWEANGKSGTDLELTVDEIELLSPKEEGSSSSAPSDW